MSTFTARGRPVVSLKLSRSYPFLVSGVENAARDEPQSLERSRRPAPKTFALVALLARGAAIPPNSLAVLFATVSHNMWQWGYTHCGSGSTLLRPTRCR